MNQVLEWEKFYQLPSSYQDPDPAFLAFMAEYYWGQEGLEFLDLGCGTGRHTFFLASKGYGVTAVDISKTACDKLQYNLIGQQKECTVVRNEDALKLDQFPEQFDCIITVNIFDYLSLDDACALAKLARKWLKPNGRLFAKMLCEDLPQQLAYQGLKGIIYGPREMSQIFVGYDVQHKPETQYIEGFAVNNWIITATKDEVSLGELKATRIYYQGDKTESHRRLTTDRWAKFEDISRLQIPHLRAVPPHELKCVIVGAAPSVKDHIDELKAQDRVIISINGAHNFLIKNDIIPNVHILYEIDLEKVEDSTGGPPHKGVKYYICSHCDQSIFDQLEGYNRILWHCFDENPECQASLVKSFPDEPIITGGFVTFFRAINIALTLGFRDFEFFGCDCSLEGENTHFNGYHNELKEIKMTVAVGTEDKHRTFITTPSLSFIANEFIRFCEAYQPGVSIKVHGNGLLRYLHQRRYPDVYDLQVERENATQFLLNTGS